MGYGMASPFLIGWGGTQPVPALDPAWHRKIKVPTALR